MNSRMKAAKVLSGLGTAILFVGCGMTQSDVEEGATTKTSNMEIPGTHSPQDLDPITARRWIDDVKLGRKLDVNGHVAQTDVTDSFLANDPIHVSMEVTDAPSGSVIGMTVINTSNGQSVWTQQKPVEPGRSHLAFSMSGQELGAGEYRAEVRVGDEPVALRPFVVSSKKG